MKPYAYIQWRTKPIILFLCFSLLVLGCKNETTISPYDLENNVDYQNILQLLRDSKKKNTDSLKSQLIVSAYDTAVELKNDSLQARTISRVAVEAIYLQDSTLFKDINQRVYDINYKRRDTFGLADAHWNYGTFYLEKELWENAYSHYYQASKLFDQIGREYYSAKMLYNMAFSQSRLRDYTGSEASIFQAITKYKPLGRNNSLYKCYNLLGIIYKELKEYSRAIYYYDVALSYLKKVENKRYQLQNSYTNLGIVYRELGDYHRSHNYFEMAINQDSALLKKNPRLYARLLDNLAYSNFLLGNHAELPGTFNKALQLRDSLNIESGMVISKLRLSEWYAFKKDTVKAINLAIKASNIAAEIKNNRDVMASLKWLSELDPDDSENYLNEYIQLNDSLQTEERKIRNKVERIRFETDEYIAKTERLSDQKIIIIAIGVTLVLFLSLLYFIRYQHVKNKELQLISEQQKANEEIYQLMIQQQSKMEEGRQQERNRISAELHDGVLGRLFGTRLGMAFLPVKGNDESVKKHKGYINELQQIEHDIRVISHDLKNETFTNKTNFVEIVEELLSTQSEVGNFTYSLINYESTDWNEMPGKLKIDLYRIIQESIQNILKYAKATHVNVRFYTEDNHLCLSVVDDGVGFEMKKKYKGIGLSNMKSRIKGHEGDVNIHSTPGEGTSVKVKVPLKFAI